MVHLHCLATRRTQIPIDLHGTQWESMLLYVCEQREHLDTIPYQPFFYRVLFLPPANEVCEGYVFTCVCQSFCSQRGCLVKTPPPPTATAAGGTHPTGMNSCWQCEHTIRVTMLSLFLKYWEDCCPQKIMNMSVGISLLKNKLHASTIHLNRLN